MQVVKCEKHETKFVLPTLEEEFVSGSLHDDVEHLSGHHEQFPTCRFEEIKNE